MMANASSWPRPFIYPQKSSETSRLMLRHKQMKETPDTLFADLQEHSAMNNLLFYTEHSPLWHTAFCQHLTFTKKRGICKGRQILAFEDAEKNDETRFLTLNLYQNGTVMAQGSESALKIFIKDFELIKKLALSDEGYKNMNIVPSPEKSVLKTTVTSATTIPSPMSRMKDNFSLLEVEVVEIKELILSHLKDNNMEQVTIDIKNLKQEVESLQRHREEMTEELQKTKDELREVKSTLGRQLTEVRKEIQEELSALKSILHTKDNSSQI